MCTLYWDLVGKHTGHGELFSTKKERPRVFQKSTKKLLQSDTSESMNFYCARLLDFSGDKHPFGSYSMLFTGVPGCWPIDFAASSVVSDWGSRRFCRLGYSMG